MERADPLCHLTARRERKNMLPVDSMKSEDDRFLLGAASAVIAGSLVAFVAGRTEFPGELLDEPVLTGLGLVLAGLGGGVLARRVIGAPWMEALGFGILLGLIVPVATGGIVATIFAPLGMIFGAMLWPVTVPAGIVWMVIVRSLSRFRPWPDQGVRAGLAFAMALALLVNRFSQPAWTDASDGTRCLSLPGEHIEAIAWSPDGSSLSIGSMPDYREGVIRILDPETGDIHEVARGPGIVPEYGRLAAGHERMTYYVEPQYGPFGYEPGDVVPPSEVFVVSPGERPRHYGWVPTFSIGDLVYTTDGIAGMLLGDPATDEAEVGRLVWIDEVASPRDRLREVTPDEAAKYPVLAALIRPDAASLVIQTPSGRRVVKRPDTYGDVRVSPDGREVVYPLTVSIDSELQDEIHAISTETGQGRILGVGQEFDDAQIAGGRLAYRTMEYPSNELCITPIDV